MTNDNIWGEYFLENISSDYAHLNKSEYLNVILGPKYLPLSMVLPITLVYVVIFVSGVVGNITTCIVIRKHPNMQTTPNCYLFNLAVSDLLLLITGIPTELSTLWEQYPWKWGLIVCKLRMFFAETSYYVSVLTIVAFSLERYSAICYPLRRYASGVKVPIRIILATWLAAFVFAVPFGIFTTVIYIEYPPESREYLEDSAFCNIVILPFLLIELYCCFFFLLPMAFMVVIYVQIGLRIRSSSLEQTVEGSVHGETKQAQSRTAIIRVLSAVVVAFFICWAPFHTQRLLYTYREQIPSFSSINDWLYPLGGCLYYISTVINLILYNAMSTKYRNAFKETLCCYPSRPSITRVDMSSARNSSTVCGVGSKAGYQVFRGRNTNYQHSIKENASCQAESGLRAADQLQSNNEEEKKRRIAGTNDSSINNKDIDEIDAESLPRVPKKSSLLVHAKNGRVRHQTGTTSNETHI
ncbi:neuropeptides capa receptor-like [Colletes gigas]|uniref:neuropeptides capa receptor-like n=1 Tax=Colletes gigas TaxID=935657 RepID=UPI001C9A499B|nr:neuropeptides capa receptor-like [Colletes gigas]